MHKFIPKMEEEAEHHPAYSEMLDMLLAAGYFRVRIRGLSPFDKLVGGLSWCLASLQSEAGGADTSTLWFTENAIIGQKIRIGDQIIRACKRLKCPHALQAHQIQGLDVAALLPVVRWLVRKVIEVREETYAFVGSSARWRWRRDTGMSEDVVGWEEGTGKKYRPKRKFRVRRQEVELNKRIHATLLEYGQAAALGSFDSSGKSDTGKKKKRDAGEQKEEKEHGEAVKAKVSSSAVGRFVGMQAEEIQVFAKTYEASKQEDPAEVHRRQLRAQISKGRKKVERMKDILTEAGSRVNIQRESLTSLRESCDEKEEKCGVYQEQIDAEDEQVLSVVMHLLGLGEDLRADLANFALQCANEREKWIRLKSEGDKLLSTKKKELEDGSLLAEAEAKHQRVAIILGKKRRRYAMLQRKLDVVPSRTELLQYEKRFVELYALVTAKLEETRKYFNVYNTLEETRYHLQNELDRMNSIHDQFEAAMQSRSTREVLVTWMESTLEGIAKIQNRVETKREEEMKTKDSLEKQYQELSDLQREYFKAVREFQEECRRSEQLQQAGRSNE